MAVIAPGIERWGWTDDLRGLIRRRISETGGLTLIVLAVLMSVALATWSVQDRSATPPTGRSATCCVRRARSAPTC
jgi:hypothetical protein